MGQRITGVILDVDGTLVDSNHAHACAWADVLREAGYDVSVEQMQSLIGMGSDKLLPTAIGVEKDAPLGKQLTEQRKRVFQQRYLPDLKPTRGATELIQYLRRRGLALMVASSADPDELESLLAVCGARDLAKRTPDSDEVDASKPDADVVQAALRHLKRPADSVVMLGDTPYDVEAALRAHVGIIGLRCGGWSDQDLEGAMAVFADPEDLLEHISEFPLAAVDDSS